MADPASSHAQPKGATGSPRPRRWYHHLGEGLRAHRQRGGELCFNTAITGYQEVMTDPSYAAQIVTFTFPHIGNVGANEEDVKSRTEGAVGCVVREEVSRQSNFRAEREFDKWMAEHLKIGLSGVDTRALTRRIRLSGAPNAVIAHEPHGNFNLPLLIKQAQEFAGLEGMDLAEKVTRAQAEEWQGGPWHLGVGYESYPLPRGGGVTGPDERPHVVAIDYGSKDNIFRNLVKAGARVTVVPARTSLEDVLALKPDGVFLSNGPGDPAATGEYAVPVISGPAGA